jgi:hypothetical protein
MAKYHGNSSSLMSKDNLKGVTNLDTKVVLAHNKELGVTLNITLREALLTMVAYLLPVRWCQSERILSICRRRW